MNREGDRLWIAFSVLIAAIGALSVLSYPYGRDQGIYAVVAAEIASGGVPYRDVWDFKPPGIFVPFVVARWLFGRDPMGIRLVELWALVSLFPASVLLSRRYIGLAVPGVFAAGIAIFAYAQLGFWNTAQPGGFGGICLIWALVCAIQPATSRFRWLFWISGATLCCVAALMKPPLGGGIVATAVVVGRAARREDVLLSSVAGYFIGGMLPLAAFGVWMAMNGALGDVYETFVLFAPAYTGAELEPLWMRIGRAVQGLVDLSPLLCVGSIALLAFEREEGESEGVIALWVIVGLQLIGVVLQGKFFPYHYAGMVPALALMSSWGLWKLWAARAPGRNLALFLSLVLAILAVAAPQRSLVRHAWIRLTAPDRAAETLYSWPGFNFGANARAAGWIAAHTRSDDFLYIWGFEPTIYIASGRRPSSRFIYNVAQRVEGVRARPRRVLMEDLSANPPAVIVVEREDALSYVTGNDLDSEAAMEDFAALKNYLRGNYHRAVTIENLDIYERN